MKTAQIIIALFFPLILLGQSKSEVPAPSILEKGENFFKRNLPDSALIYAQTILSHPKLGLFDQGQALWVLGNAYLYEGYPDDAVPPIKKSLTIARSIKNKNLILKSLVVLSASMGSKEYPRMDSVLICLDEARPLAEALRDTSSMVKIFNNYSNVFYDKGDYDKALVNYYLCESLLKNSRFDFEKGLCSYGKGRNLFELYMRDGKIEDLKSAEDSYQKAIDIFVKLEKKSEEALARNALGVAALYLENYEKAEKETKHSIKLGELIKDSIILINGYYNLANQYEAESKRPAAIEALSQMALLLEETGTVGDASFITKQFSSETKVSIALIKNKVGLLNKEMEVIKSAQEKQFLWFLSILLGIILIGISFYFYQKNKIAAQKNKILQEELENTLKSQEIEFMRARFEGEEEGRHRIARQIHDGVGGLLVSAKWNLESALEEISKKEIKVAARLNENLRLQENSYKELRRVVYELEREDIPWWEDLQRLYQQLTERNSTKIKFYTYNLDKRVGAAIGEEARLIVQEIITNALKHANATEINVQINQIEDVLGIIIEDNGIGFDQSKVVKGVGLRSIEERCSKLGGEISLETGKGAGTTVFVDIPISKQNILKENPLLYAGAN